MFCFSHILRLLISLFLIISVMLAGCENGRQRECGTYTSCSQAECRLYFISLHCWSCDVLYISIRCVQGPDCCSFVIRQVLTSAHWFTLMVKHCGALELLSSTKVNKTQQDVAFHSCKYCFPLKPSFYRFPPVFCGRSPILGPSIVAWTCRTLCSL